MIKLNPFQEVVVRFRQGYAVAMAAPGSGKTAVVIERIKQLLAEGVRPEDILSITFTKEGAKEMAARAGVKDEDYKRNGIKHKLFTTFHSWALGFIKQEALALPFKVHMDWHGHPAPLCLPQDAARTLAQICRRLPKVEWKDAQGYISRCKRMGISPNQAYQLSRTMPTAGVPQEVEEYFILAYQKYEEALRAKGLLDFDSVVIETAKLLENRADVRQRWQYRFVQIDEAQDTDAVQWRIMKAITSQYGCALAVGDENQGMYSWRGSESNLSQYFCSIFPSAKVMPLPVNYRSTGAIVNYCKEIAPIKNETVENLSTPNEHGVAPEFRFYPQEIDEAEGVINACTDLGNTAVLARTNRQLATFEDACAQRNLRYKLLGKSGFWSQPEVKDAVAILGSVAMPSDANVLRMLTARCEATKFLRKNDAYNQPSTITLLKEFQQHNTENDAPVLLHRLLSRFHCGESMQEDVLHRIGGLLYDLRQHARTMPAKEATSLVFDRFGLLSIYDETEDDDEDNKKSFDNDPRENILKLLDYSSRYATLDKVYDYTQRARKATLARTNCLTLSTIHQAKGKEWPNVFVVGVNEEVLPHKKGDLEEEKRIYFVACSRAAKRLHVSASGVASAFIADKLPKEPAKAVELDPWAGFQLQG